MRLKSTWHHDATRQSSVGLISRAPAEGADTSATQKNVPPPTAYGIMKSPEGDDEVFSLDVNQRDAAQSMQGKIWRIQKAFVNSMGLEVGDYVTVDRWSNSSLGYLCVQKGKHNDQDYAAFMVGWQVFSTFTASPEKKF
jgi:hypothetical protein